MGTRYPRMTSSVVTVRKLFTGLPLGHERGPVMQSWFKSKDPTPVDTSVGARLVEIEPGKI